MKRQLAFAVATLALICGALVTQQMMAQQGAPGGGFFRSALTTAAGVAGGMMVANSLSGLFGGGHQAHASELPHADNSGVLTDADATQDELQDQAGYEPDVDTSSTDTGGGWDGVDT